MQPVVKLSKCDEALLVTIAKQLQTTVRTPGYKHVAAGVVGAIAAGYRAFSVTNTGVTDALLAGEVLPTGITVDYAAGGQKDTLGGMSYDSQASTLTITTVL